MPFRNYCPAAHLAQMGVRVEYIENLDELGYYIHEERRVLIRAGMTDVCERNVLAHEAAHAELRHEPQEQWCHFMQQERMASAMAGRRLVNFHLFAKLQAEGVSERGMCEQLGVARVILRAYKWLTAPAWQLAA